MQKTSVPSSKWMLIIFMTCFNNCVANGWGARWKLEMSLRIRCCRGEWKYFPCHVSCIWITFFLCIVLIYSLILEWQVPIYCMWNFHLWCWGHIQDTGWGWCSEWYYLLSLHFMSGDKLPTKITQSRSMASSIVSVLSLWGHCVTWSLVIKPWGLQKWHIWIKDWSVGREWECHREDLEFLFVCSSWIFFSPFWSLVVHMEPCWQVTSVR